MRKHIWNEASKRKAEWRKWASENLGIPRITGRLSLRFS